MVICWQINSALPFRGGRPQATFFLFLLLQKGEQIGVQPILMGNRKAVRCIVIHFQLRMLNHLMRQLAGRLKGYNLIVTAVDHQRGHIDFSDIIPEVRLCKRRR